MNSSDIESLLECSVCLERLNNDHKVLPCQHTFCIRCLEDIVKKSKGIPYLCPECRTSCSTPLANLPSNIILNRILNGINSRKDSRQKHPHKSSREQPSGTSERLSIPGNHSTNPFISFVPNLPPKPFTESKPNHDKSKRDSPLPPPPLPPPLHRPPAPPAQSKMNQVYRAMYDYNPVKEDELELKKQELYVVIEKREDGWFKGSSIQTLKTGFFPGNYVMHVKFDSAPYENGDLIDLNDDDDELRGNSSSSNSVSSIGISGNESSSSSSSSTGGIDMDVFNTTRTIVPPNVTTSSTSSFPKPPVLLKNAKSTSTVQPPPKREKYRCIMSFPASGQYELSLEEGDIIYLENKRDDGWCKGTLLRTGRVGIFPFNFVQKI